MSLTTTEAGAASEALVRERAHKLVERNDPPQVLLLQASPHWDGPKVLQVSGRTVRVGIGLSQLDILDQIVRLDAEEYLVVLTDRTQADLGETVLMRVRGRRIERLDEWDALSELFGAKDLARGFRRAGAWVPSALLLHRPPAGWPHVTAGLLTIDHALSCLLTTLLGLPAGVELDDAHVLARLDQEDVRASWREIDTTVRAGLTEWARHAIGPVAPLALAVASQPTAVSPVAIGLAIDVLWPEGKPPLTQDQSRAQARVEPWLGGHRPSDSEARAYADESRQLLRAPDQQSAPARRHLRTQAESLLEDLGWAEGATTSATLPAGLWARLRQLAAALGDSSSREDALAHVTAHDLAAVETAEITRAEMAVRLARWLDSDHGSPTRVGEALLSYAHDGGWADRAFEEVWVGSVDTEVAAAYGRLLDRVQEERRRQDAHTARLLADATADDGPSTHVGSDGTLFPVEALVPDLVAPMTRKTGVLLIVLDGMSVRVASELAESLREWTELVPEGSTRRAAALSTLPTVTTYARTSLFSGQLVTGQQGDEKRAFIGPLFHKNDLRSPGGSRLPEQVTDAIASTRQPVVGAVLNTIDDALSRHDPGGTRWRADQVQHLEALLSTAHAAGRTVVLTADHGHVVEHGSTARSVAGADARWRPADSGAAGDGEVLLTGRRVLAPGGRAILPWREDIRYASLQAGYHGGASAAELTVPVLVLAPDPRIIPPGWEPAIPQAPTWWNSPVTRRTDHTPAVAAAPKRHSRRSPAPAPDQDALELDIPEPANAEADLVDALLSSEMYRAQRAKAGRVAPADDQVAAVLRTLLSTNGRMHRDAVASSIGDTTATLATRLAALRRILNVEGYPVLGHDPDGVTVVLDASLLREQFEV